MDFLEYFAFGGLERVAIIGGSLVIGYWGYRLYGAGKPAGLAFMTIACVVLAGALLTGTSHVRSVGESIQLASVPPRDSAVPAAAPTAGDAPSRDRADRAREISQAFTEQDFDGFERRQPALSTFVTMTQ